jgi:hypothetical protein
LRQLERHEELAVAREGRNEKSLLGLPAEPEGQHGKKDQ